MQNVARNLRYGFWNLDDDGDEYDVDGEDDQSRLCSCQVNGVDGAGERRLHVCDEVYDHADLLCGRGKEIFRSYCDCSMEIRCNRSVNDIHPHT